MGILKTINSSADLQGLSESELAQLCLEIRSFLTENIARSGGHLSSNLGIVELTVALHRVYDTARDRVVFDVGHQSYVHKILTGRRDEFSTLRGFGGISGFPLPQESEHDAFVAGHASNSISAALGIARARTLSGEDYNVAALIGDGALTGGLAYEGLSNAGVSGEPLLAILNDNGMSINTNVGSIAKLLTRMRLKPEYFHFKRAYQHFMAKIPRVYSFLHSIKERIKLAVLQETFFEELGFYYLGPVDGTDLEALEAAMLWARQMKQPVLLHVKTRKGMGIPFAEKKPDIYHGVGAFNAQTGGINGSKKDFSRVFGEELLSLAREDSRVCALTAAMESGTGLTGFARELPSRFFDVGIAEGHAVSMAAGMASGGMIPVFAVYSTFLPRSYDMLIHDASLMNLHVVLGVDRAGIVGRDGITHQGVFDAAFLGTVPNMKIYSPASFAELREMLASAIIRDTGPVAVRYPRGCEGEYRDSWNGEECSVMRSGTDVTIVSYGVIINEVLSAAVMLEKAGISAEIIKLNVINPLAADEVYASIEKTGRLVVVEDTIETGGVGERILAGAGKRSLNRFRARLLNAGNGIITHGEVSELRSLIGIDAEAIGEAAVALMENLN